MTSSPSTVNACLICWFELTKIEIIFLISFHVFLDVQYSGSLNLWKTEGANARLSFARAGKALAISGANNSVQVISGQSLLQWTEDSSVELQGRLRDSAQYRFFCGWYGWPFVNFIKVMYANNILLKMRKNLWPTKRSPGPISGPQPTGWETLI